MRAVFRCDATARIGFGHLSRCIAIAEALRLSRVSSTFAGLFDAAAKDQIKVAGLDQVDLAGPVHTEAADSLLSDLIAQETNSFIVVDSYDADEAYLSRLKALGSKIVVIDDFGALEKYPCDVVLNFTWEANLLGYPEGPVLFLGPRYFPARRQFVELRRQSIERKRAGPVRNLLIAIGGADPKRIAGRLARILASDQSDICLHVIAGDAADFPDRLAAFAPGSLVLPRQPDLSKQLLWADACISGGGLIKYESAFMGVPAAAISQNDGQAKETRSLSQGGLVFDLGLADDRSDMELANELDRFLADDDLRSGLATSNRHIFPSDPSAHAALAILEAIGR